MSGALLSSASSSIYNLNPTQLPPALLLGPQSIRWLVPFPFNGAYVHASLCYRAPQLPISRGCESEEMEIADDRRS